MEHERAQDLLSDYQEGTLDAPERAELEAHLEACPTCRDDLAMLQQAMQMMRGLPQVEAPAHFARRVQRRARQAGLLGRGRKRRQAAPHVFTFTTAMLMAAMAALILFVLIVQQQIELLIVPPGPAAVQVAPDRDLQPLAELTWYLGGRVQAGGATIAPGARLPAADALDLFVPAGAVGEFEQGLKDLGLVPPGGPPPAADPEGRIAYRIARGPVNDAGNSGSEAP